MFVIMNVDYWTLAEMGKAYYYHLFCAAFSGAYTRYRHGSKWVEELDWSWGFFHSAVRVYEACDDCVLVKVFVRTAETHNLI